MKDERKGEERRGDWTREEKFLNLVELNGGYTSGGLLKKNLASLRASCHDAVNAIP